MISLHAKNYFIYWFKFVHFSARLTFVTEIYWIKFIGVSVGLTFVQENITYIR